MTTTNSSPALLPFRVTVQNAHGQRFVRDVRSPSAWAAGKKAIRVVADERRVPQEFLQALEVVPAAEIPVGPARSDLEGVTVTAKVLAQNLVVSGNLPLVLDRAACQEAADAHGFRYARELFAALRGFGFTLDVPPAFEPER